MRTRGYTLIELLVVAAIVAIVAAVAVLALRPDPGYLLESESHRLARQLELAQARARLGGGPLAFSATGNAYAFWRRDAAGIWREIGGDHALAARTLDERLAITGLSAGGMPIAAGQRISLVADDPAPLAITLSGPGRRALVQSSTFDGRVDVRIAAGD